MRLAVWRSRRSERLLSKVSMSLTEVAAGIDRDGGTVTLHFRVTGSDAAGLDALRETRRAVIREDWALGLEDGEPSLADAMFTSHDVTGTSRSGNGSGAARESRPSSLERIGGSSRRGEPGPRPVQSARSALSGSMRLARRAGMTQAAAAKRARAIAAVASVATSFAATP